MEGAIFYSIPAIKQITAITSCIMITACASNTYNPRFVPTAVHFNKVVEETNNELLLLNIIRASERRPMYFTRISALRSSLSSGGTIGVNSALPQQDSTEAITNAGGTTTQIVDTVSRGVNTVTPSASATFSITPSFDYEILDSQDFYRGILQPIPVETLAHYMLQGWSNDLVAMLAIEKIEIRKKNTNEVIKTYDNDPDNSQEALEFRDFLSCAPLEAREQSSSKVISFQSINNSNVNTLEHVDLFENSGWAFNDKDQLTLSRANNDTLAFGDKSAACRDITLQPLIRGNVTPDFSAFTLSNNFVTQEVDNIGSPTQLLVVSNDYDVYITTRSIHGILYYLGECLRASNENCAYPDNRQKAITTITQSKPENGYFLKTSLYGKTYYIPANDSDNDRTYQSLAFVNQLLNLQKTASASPTTTNVRVVN